MQILLPMIINLLRSFLAQNRLHQENARIWVISPNEPSNKQAYFVHAPYQVDKITAKLISFMAGISQRHLIVITDTKPLYS